LFAALDAKASGKPLEPALAGRVSGLLSALGGKDLLDDITADEARALASEVKMQLGFDGLLVDPETRRTSWTYANDRLLSDIGELSRAHAHAITKGVVPALAGLDAKLGAAGASFLDIGVGVAGTATELARLWPALRVVGLDVWQPSLALARKNVQAAGLSDRIEIREQGAETLTEDQAFELAWMPMNFIPERVLPAALERTFRALRAGGWLIVPNITIEHLDGAGAALWRLRMTMFGGPIRAASDVETLVEEKGFTDVKTLPRAPHVPITFTVGRRAS
jgi:precorrin-6B methylase 2